MNAFQRFVSVLSIGAAALAPTGTALAGGLFGPRIFRNDVDAYSTIWYSLPLQAGDRTYISVIGDGDTDIDCEVRDDLNNVIAVDNGPSSSCALWVDVYRTSYFRLYVQNLGRVYSTVVVTTN